jgi:hypothetical protein
MDKPVPCMARQSEWNSATRSIVALQRYSWAEGWTISRRSAVIGSYR